MTTPKKQYTLKSLDYNLAILKDGKFYKKPVSGYAVDFGLPVKICIRHECDTWYADEIETGFSIRDGGFSSLDLDQALLEIEKLLAQKLADDSYVKAISKAKTMLNEQGFFNDD